MNNNSSDNSHKKSTSDPASRNYAKEVKNKANEKSPSGEDEPSPRTTYKQLIDLNRINAQIN